MQPVARFPFEVTAVHAVIGIEMPDDPKNRSWRPIADAGKQAMARVSELFGPLPSSYLLGDRATSQKPVTHRQLEP
jgi:hypothetical protein